MLHWVREVYQMLNRTGWGGADSEKAIDFIAASVSITVFLCCKLNGKVSKARKGEVSFLHTPSPLPPLLSV